MYSKILVPLDGSSFAEQIVPVARLISERYQIPVELLRMTITDVSRYSGSARINDNYLKETAAKHFSSSIRVTTSTEAGDAAQVIVDRAKNDPSCLIAMATHGMSGTRRWILGSVTSKVVQSAANPLLLIRPTESFDARARFRLDRVFVPLDGSILAEKTVPHACALGKRLNVEIHLVRVYSLPMDSYVVADGVIAQGPAQYREKLEKEAETYLAGKVAGLQAAGLEHVVALVVEGDSAGEIIDLARKTPHSLIAMSTHGRSGIGRWVLGSIAEKVIQHAHSPVLLIRATE